MAVWILTLYTQTHTQTHSDTDTAPLLWSLEHTPSECECVCGAYHVCVVTSKKVLLKMGSLSLTITDDVTLTIFCGEQIVVNSYLLSVCVAMSV